MPVFRETSKYQYSQGVGDVLRGILRFIPTVERFLKPVSIMGAQTFLKSGSKAIKEGATIKDVIKSTLKMTVGAVLGVTVDQVDSKLIQMLDNYDFAPPPNPPIELPEIVQAGSGRKRRRAPVYNKATNVSSSNQTTDQLFIIFKMATIGADVTKKITIQVDQFASIKLY